MLRQGHHIQEVRNVSSQTDNNTRNKKSELQVDELQFRFHVPWRCTAATQGKDKTIKEM